MSERFDEFTRQLAERSPRRKALLGLGALGLGSLGMSAFGQDAERAETQCAQPQ